MALSKVFHAKVIEHTSCNYEEQTDSETHIATPSIPALVIRPENPIREKFYYAIRIVTGSQSGADPDTAAVFVSLTGSKGETGEIEVDAKTGWFFAKTYFKKSTYDDLVIECDGDLGDIQVVTAGLHFRKSKLSIMTPDWFIDYFTVANYQQTGVTSDFPCYHWIGDTIKSVSATSKTATLQQVANNPVLVEQRSKLLKERRKLYEWKVFTDSGIPSGIDESVLTLPLDEQFQRAKMVNFLGNLFKGLLASSTADLRVEIMEKLSQVLQMRVNDDISLADLHEFEFIAKTMEVKNLEDSDPPKELPIDPDIPCYEGYRWVSDVEFGRQMLNGVNPVVIRKCTKIPDNFAVTGDMVKPLLSNGTKTLEEEMKNGHIYICDLSDILHGLPTRKGYYLAAPLCLLYVNASKQLVPIAIQLKRDPGPDNPVFLPSDGWFEWLLAKMYYRAADAQFHQLSSHYISCHASMEAYGVATMRNIPDAHPLYKLLQPHFRYTMSINSAARASLINENGIIARNFAVGNDGMFELFKRAGTAHRVQWTNIKRSIKERGVDNPDELPGYYYRDDGVRVWDAIEGYVKEIIDLFYANDDDVKNDSEVQQWAEEIHTIAFPGFNGAPQGHGFPEEMKTKDELIEYCTLIIFTGSAQHAAVNFGQFDTYGYTPNAPIGMRKPTPHMRSKIGYRDLMKYLPDISTAAMASSITFSLAQFSPDEIFLGGYPEFWYTEEKASNAVDRFVKNLEDLDQKIVKRNQSLDVHYFYLRPTRVPNSITI